MTRPPNTLLSDFAPRWDSSQRSSSALVGDVAVTPHPEEVELANDGSSAAEIEGEDDEEMDEPDSGDPLASLPENATEEEHYQALTSQSLNADGTPKRPMNAFMIWGRRRRPQLADRHPMLRTGDISKLMSDEWSSMGKDEKEYYQNMAKRLKDAFNARWPTYVYKRRPNNSRRKRKKADTQDDGVARSPAMPGKVVKKRGSIGSVSSASGTSPRASRPSSAVKPNFDMESTVGRVPSQPTTGSGEGGLASDSFSPKSPSFGSYRQPQSSYSSFERSGSSSNQNAWQWTSNSMNPDLGHPAQSTSSFPALLRQHSHSSLQSIRTSVSPQSGQHAFKREDDEHVVFRSDPSPEPEPTWSNASVSDPMPFSGLHTSFTRPDMSQMSQDWSSSFNLSSSFPSMSQGQSGTMTDRLYTGQSLPPLQHDYSSNGRVPALSFSPTPNRYRGSSNMRSPGDLTSTGGIGRAAYAYPAMGDSFHHQDTLHSGHSAVSPHMHSNQQGFVHHSFPPSSTSLQSRSPLQHHHSMSSFSTSARSISIPTRMASNTHIVGIPEDTPGAYWGTHPEAAR